MSPRKPSANFREPRAVISAFVLVLTLLPAFCLLGCGDQSRKKQDAPVADDSNQASSAAERAEMLRLLREADRALADSDFELAHKNLGLAQAANPRDIKTIPAMAHMAQAQDLKKRADNDAFLGKPDLAYRKLREAHALHPWSLKIHSQFGKAALEVRRFSEAQELYTNYLAVEADDLEAHRSRAVAAFRAGDHVQALEYLGDMSVFEKMAGGDVKKRGFLPILWFMRGLSAKQRELGPLAKESLTKACELAPQQLEFRAQLAAFLMDQGAFEEAIASYKIVAATAPNYRHVLHNTGRCYDMLGKITEAIDYYRKSIASAPTNWSTYSHLGRCLEQDKAKLDEARMVLEAGLERNPLSHEILHNLQSVYRRLGRKEQAKKTQARYARIKAFIETQAAQMRVIAQNIVRDPKDLKSRLEGIEINAKNRHFDDALEDVKALLVIDPKNFSGLKHLTILLNSRNNSRDAFFESLKMIDFHPDRSEGYSNAAVFLLRMNRSTEALAYANKAYELNPTDIASIEALVAVMQERGGFDKELAELAPLYRTMKEHEDRLLEENQARQRALEKRLAEGEN